MRAAGICLSGFYDWDGLLDLVSDEIIKPAYLADESK